MYSWSRFTCTSKSEPGSTAIPVSRRMRAASCSFLRRLTARNSTWKSGSSASGSRRASWSRSVTQPLPELDAAPPGAKKGWEQQVGLMLKCLTGEDEGLECRFGHIGCDRFDVLADHFFSAPIIRGRGSTKLHFHIVSFVGILKLVDVLRGLAKTQDQQTGS